MNLAKKTLAGIALTGALLSVHAEQMIFGAVVEPIMSVEVNGRIVPAEALLTGTTTAAGDAPVTSDAVVGTFRVTSNVVKWNVTMKLENGGVLKNWAGTGLATETMDAADAGKIGVITDATTDKLFVTMTSIDGTAATAVAQCNGQMDITDGATAADCDQLEAAVDADDLLTTVLWTGEAYIFNNSKNALAFDVKTSITGQAITALAGTYTETLNLALYGSY